MQPNMPFNLVLLAFLAVAFAPPAETAPLERRLALVIGNASYESGALPTPANDAGLIAQSLQAAGFDVVGARDLDESSLREAFRDFVEKASKAGPDTVAAVYFAGYGLQFEGENYLLPTNASIGRGQDIPAQALRVSDYMRALAALHFKATIVVLDAARASPLSVGGDQQLASGLAWVRPEPGTLIAFNATPGTIAGRDQQDYGAYAKALAEMLRAGGFSPAGIFERVRLRVNEMTKGAQIPWDASNIETQVTFLESGPGAPPRSDSPELTASMRSRPMGDLSAQDAYMVALLRDTFDGYADYLAAYSRDPMAKRVRAILAVRREVITWRLSHQVDTSEAYWSYLIRYPRGPHARDAHRLLAHLGAAPEPPRSFAMIDFEVPSPLPGEPDYLERPVLAFDDPVFAAALPPPLPAYFLEPAPPELAALESPPAPREAHTLPVPLFVPVPAHINAPAYVATPPNPFIFNNIHNRVVTNNATRIATITKPDGQTVSVALTLDAGGAFVAALDPPPSVAPKAGPVNSQASSAANPGTIGEIALPHGQPSPTTSSAAPQPTGTQPTSSTMTLSKPTATGEPPSNPLVAAAPPLATPAVATLSPLTDKIPLPIPRAAGRPQTRDNAPSNPPLAALSPQTTDGAPSSATLLPPTSGNIRLPVPRPVPSSPQATDISAPETDIIPLPTPRPTPVSRRSPVPPTSPAVVQPPQPAPAVVQPAPAHPLSPPAASKPQKTTCQVVNDKQVCKQGVTQ
jgi:uncharacterized caspase-like protein